MSAFFKVIFGILGGLILLAVAGGIAALLFFRSAIFGVERAVESSRGNVDQVAEQIATVRLPEGFVPDYTFSTAGYSVAAYRGPDGHSHLILASGPKDLDLESEEFKKTAGQQTGSRYAEIRPVSSFVVQIHGQPVTVQVGEGSNSDNQPYRQAYAVFQGQSGPTLVQLTRPVSAWDDAEVKEFFASIQ